MDIGIASLVGHLIDAVTDLNGGRTEKVAKGVGRDRIRMVVEDSIDLPAGRGAAPAAEEQVRATGIRPVLQVLPDSIDHLVPDEDHPGLVPLVSANRDFLGRQGIHLPV